MPKSLKKLLTEIFDTDDDPKPDAIYSVFDKWLTEEECGQELMHHSDINSFERYKIFKTREHNYLKLLVALNEHFKLEYIDLKMDRVVNKSMDFHFIFLLLEKHFFQDKNILLRVPNSDTCIFLSYDFSIIVYFANDVHKELKRIFKKHHFNLLCDNTGENA